MVGRPPFLLIIHNQSKPTNLSLYLEIRLTAISGDARRAISRDARSEIVSSEKPRRSRLASPNQFYADDASVSSKFRACMLFAPTGKLGAFIKGIVLLDILPLNHAHCGNYCTASSIFLGLWSHQGTTAFLRL